MKQALIFLVVTLFCYASCTKLFLDLSSTKTYPEILKFTLYNPTTADFSFLNWHTPFEGIRGNIFDITHRGTGLKAQYQGMIVRRGLNFTDEDFVAFSAGQSKSVSINLFDNYFFPFTGEYVISYSSPFTAPEVTFSATTMITLSESDVTYNQRVLKTNEEMRLNPLTHTNCNAQKESQVNAAVTSSRAETLRAYNCMTGRSSACLSLATRWFGVTSGALYEYDRSCFNTVNARLQPANTFNAYCDPQGCGANVYGYVYPNDPAYTVYVCGLFWSLPAERVNTIVHEMSHFSRLCGTDDYAYGQSNCLRLAQTNPNQATRNADNVCYFSGETV